MKADYHIHTSYSPDSFVDMEDYIICAIKNNFDEICFTDHIDYGNESCYCCDCVNYLKEINNYQKKYSNKIKIKFGMEFGAQARHKDYFNRIFNNWDFDFIILSFHLIDDLDLWDRSYQRGKTQDEFNLGYYQEILNTIKVYDNYSVLGHLDLIRRYDDYGEYPFLKTKDIVAEILSHLIENDKGIELNTSSFRYNLEDLMPRKEILKLYKDLGGKIITIGSDSHQCAHLGYKIKEMKEVLKNIGFKYFCTFDKMSPQFHML